MKRWYVEVDGTKTHYTSWAEAKEAFRAAIGEHVYLCREDGTVLDCRP